MQNLFLDQILFLNLLLPCTLLVVSVQDQLGFDLVKGDLLLPVLLGSTINHQHELHNLSNVRQITHVLFLRQLDLGNMV